MKKLFWLVAVVAVLGSMMNGCKKNDPKDPQKPKEETFVPENDFDIFFNGTEAKMFRKGVEMQNGDTIVAEKFDEFANTVEFTGYVNISSLLESPLNVKINEHRTFDLTNYSSEMCVDMCMSSNEEINQTWNIGNLEPEAQQKFTGHVCIGDSVLSVPANIVSEYEVTDGKCSAKFVVKYVYTPQE